MHEEHSSYVNGGELDFINNNNLRLNLSRCSSPPSHFHLVVVCCCCCRYSSISSSCCGSLSCFCYCSSSSSFRSCGFSRLYFTAITQFECCSLWRGKKFLKSLSTLYAVCLSLGLKRQPSSYLKLRHGLEKCFQRTNPQYHPVSSSLALDTHRADL